MPLAQPVVVPQCKCHSCTICNVYDLCLFLSVYVHRYFQVVLHINGCGMYCVYSARTRTAASGTMMQFGMSLEHAYQAMSYLVHHLHLTASVVACVAAAFNYACVCVYVCVCACV